MKLHRYLDGAGRFDYDLYRRTQAKGNKRKIHCVWAVEENIRFLAGYIKEAVPYVAFGLCHGTRRGLEQKWFSDALGCRVIGTEISDTADQFDATIRWDFHNVKPEWRGAVDFIYSNALDHSYDPAKCLSAWVSCLSPGGLCIIEHSSGHETTSALDPFGASVEEMPYLVLRWSGGDYCITQILDAPVVPGGLDRMVYFVVRAVWSGQPSIPIT